MKCKCTIEIDGETYSAEHHGDAADNSVVGRSVAAALSAIGGVDGNLTVAFVLAEAIKEAGDSPYILKAAAQAWCAHDIDEGDMGHKWRVLVDESLWDERAARRDVAHLARKADLSQTIHSEDQSDE